MDINTLAQLVSNLGFPIAACAAMFWKLNKDEERHKEETEKLADAVNNNTDVINTLLLKLDDIIRKEN